MAYGHYNPDEPRDERGRWTTGLATPINHFTDLQRAGVAMAMLKPALEKYGIDRTWGAPREQMEHQLAGLLRPYAGTADWSEKDFNEVAKPPETGGWNMPLARDAIIRIARAKTIDQVKEGVDQLALFIRKEGAVGWPWFLIMAEKRAARNLSSFIGDSRTLPDSPLRQKLVAKATKKARKARVEWNALKQQLRAAKAARNVAATKLEAALWAASHVARDVAAVQAGRANAGPSKGIQVASADNFVPVLPAAPNVGGEPDVPLPKHKPPAPRMSPAEILDKKGYQDAEALREYLSGGNYPPTDPKFDSFAAYAFPAILYAEGGVGGNPPAGIRPSTKKSILDSPCVSKANKDVINQSDAPSIQNIDSYYRAVLDYTMGRIAPQNGYSYLSNIHDYRSRLAFADALFAVGLNGGADCIRSAIAKTYEQLNTPGGNPGETDRIGPKSFDAYVKLSENPDTRGLLITNLEEAMARIVLKGEAHPAFEGRAFHIHLYLGEPSP